jgi:hypothetical protein
MVTQNLQPLMQAKSEIRMVSPELKGESEIRIVCPELAGRPDFAHFPP